MGAVVREKAPWPAVSGTSHRESSALLRVVIVDGVYSNRPELAGNYDLRIAIETPHATRLARGLARDGQHVRHALHQWEKVWMPSEEEYVVAEEPFSSADLVLDGSGRRADFGNG